MVSSVLPSFLPSLPSLPPITNYIRRTIALARHRIIAAMLQTIGTSVYDNTATKLSDLPFMFAGTIAPLIGSGAVVRSIEYRPGFGAKQLAWMAHAGIVGAVIAPLSFLGGPLLIRAAT